MEYGVSISCYIIALIFFFRITANEKNWKELASDFFRAAYEFSAALVSDVKILEQQKNCLLASTVFYLETRKTEVFFY